MQIKHLLIFIVLACIANVTIGQTIHSFSESEKQELIKLHNDARREPLNPPAIGMADLIWDDELAQVAAEYVEQCKFAHNDNRTNAYSSYGHTGYVGENMYVLGAGVSGSGKTSFQGWYSEKADYTYSPLYYKNDCASGKVCGHYAQLIWQKTKLFGCARKDCSSVRPNEVFKTIIICDYYPGGDIYDTAPYIAGTTSSVVPKNSTATNGTTMIGQSVLVLMLALIAFFKL